MVSRTTITIHPRVIRRERIGATPFRWTVLGLRLDFQFAESFRS